MMIAVLMKVLKMKLMDFSVHRDVNGNGRQYTTNLALALVLHEPRPHITSFGGVWFMQSAQVASVF